MTTTIEVGVEFFLPTDARHWIPNGFTKAMVEVDLETLEIGETWEWLEEVEAAAEAWCEKTHGKGSFSQVIMEP